MRKQWKQMMTICFAAVMVVTMPGASLLADEMPAEEIIVTEAAVPEETMDYYESSGEDKTIDGNELLEEYDDGHISAEEVVGVGDIQVGDGVTATFDADKGAVEFTSQDGELWRDWVNRLGVSISEIKTIKVSSGTVYLPVDSSGYYYDEYNNKNMYCLFGGLSNLNSLDLSSFDTSNVTDMSGMFYNCCNLRSLDLSSFDTSNVTNMSHMFYNCYSVLTSLDLSSFNTSNVTDMSGMFYSCWGLRSLNLSSFDTSNVTDMSSMFKGCDDLRSLDLSSFDTSNVTDMSSMFNDCNYLKSLDLSSFDTSNVTDMSSMFEGCYNGLTSLDLSSFNTSNVTDMSGMFYYCDHLTSLELSSFNTSNVTDMESMFRECNTLTNLDLSGFDTSNVTDMSYMFLYCENLTSLDLSSFNTSNVTKMKSMFDVCQSLTNLDLSSFDTSNVKNMHRMFFDCNSLKNLDLSSFDTSNVTDMSYMFLSCENLTSLDLSNFDTSNETDMNSMFSGCRNLTELDLSSFDTSNVTSMTDMFTGCSSLTELDLSSFDTSNVTSMSWMFFGCSSLTSLDLSSFNTQKVTYMGCMFSDCSSLQLLKTPKYNTKSIALPHLMYDESGSVYTTLPIKKSIVLSTEKGNAVNGGSKLVSGIIREGDGWSICWQVTYDENTSGDKANAQLNIYLKGSNASDGSLLLYSLLGNGFLMPWLTEEYGFSKSVFNRIRITGGEQNPFEIISDTFSGYDNVTNVEMYKVKSVQSRAFENCTDITTLRLDHFLTTINDASFRNCSSLKDIYYFGTDRNWNEMSIGSDNGNLANAAVHYYYLSSFSVTEDAWSFSNSDTVFGEGRFYISHEDMKKYTPMQRLIVYLRQEEWSGSCYGMASVAVLSKMGVIPPGSIQAGKQSLYSISAPNDDKVESTINFYQFQQYFLPFVSAEYNFLRLSDKEKLLTIQDYAERAMEGEQPFLLVYNGLTDEGEEYGHALVGYGVEHGSYKIAETENPQEKKEYDSRIMLYNCNYPGEVQYLYYNLETGSWIFPFARNATELDAAVRDRYVLDTAQSGLEADYSLKSFIYTSKDPSFTLSSGDASFDITRPGVYGGGEVVVYSPISETKDGSQEVDTLIAVVADDKSYTITPNGSVSGKMLCQSCEEVISLDCGSVEQAEFAASGEVALTGVSGDCTLRFVQDTPSEQYGWNIAEFSGQDLNGDLAVGEQSGGFMIIGSAIDGLNIRLSDEVSEETASANLSITTDQTSVMMTGTLEDVNLFTDPDCDGIYDNKIGTGTGGGEGEVTSLSVTLSATSYTYDGKEKKPTVTVRNGNAVLTSGTDYTLSYADNINVGTATVKVTGTGNYKGEKYVTFTIKKANAKLVFAESTVKKKTTDAAFTIALTKTTDGTVTFNSSNTKVATVDSASGLVNIKGAGTAKITASAAEGTNYKAGSSSYTLTVEASAPTTAAIGFSDVQNPTHPYYKAIYWAAGEGITKGYSDGTFGINRSCTRGEMMMFLWRYAGKPTPKNVSKSPFKDVPKTHTFYKAILWGSQKGITKGYSDGTFGINRNVSRGECMMFLWRLKGKPAPKAVAKSPFPDVPKSHVFYNAVLWGYQKKITTGFTSGKLKGKFGVNENCSRGQIVTFLYRAK